MKRRTGRRPGESGTREAILDAARRQFASRGYTATTIRAVAAAADVDPALVAHFFGTKDGLFTAALQLPDDLPSVLLSALRAQPKELAGARFAEAYLALWEEPATAVPLTAMFRSATTNEQAAQMLREFLAARLTEKGAGVGLSLGTLELAAAQLLGVAIGRHIIRIEPLASMSLPDLIERIRPAIDALLAADTGFESTGG